MPKLWTLLLAGLFVLPCGAAQARTLSLSATRLHAPGVTARDVRVRVEDGAGAGSLRIDTGQLELPALALAGRIEWSCALERDGDERVCAGPVRFLSPRGAAHEGELAARISGQRLEVNLAHGDSQVALTIPFAASEAPTASLRQVPAAWIKAPLAQAWRGGELRSGVFDANVTRAVDGRLSGDFSVAGLSLNTLDGSVAGQQVNASGQVDWMAAAGESHLVAAAQIHGGALRIGTLDVHLPDAPVAMNLDARVRDDGTWQVARFGWRDGEALAFEASGEFDPAALAPLRTLAVHVERARLPQMTQRYAQGLLAAQGLGTLSLKGEFAGDLAIEASGVQRIALSTAALDVDDGADRVALKGIRGAIDWAADGERPPTTLAWKSAQVEGLALGAASARWQSRNGALHLLGSVRTKLLGGELTLRDTVLNPRAGAGDLLDTAFALRGIGYDSADGASAAASVAADGHLRVSGVGGEPRLQLQSRLLGGEVLAGPVYLKLPATPVVATLDASLAGAHWQVHAFEWNDPGVLDFSANGTLAPLDAQPLKSLQVDVREAKLGPALERYAQTWLASKGYGELDAAGALSGSLALDGAGLERFAFVADGVDLRDGAGRFALRGIDGGVSWNIRGGTPATTLGWQSIELFRIPLGAARARLESRRRAIELAEPLAIDVLGGQWRIEKLSLQPRSPRGERYTASFALVGIEMAQLSAVLGWPHFGGNLSGGIPEIEFSGDTLQLRGGLDLYVFDGHVGVSGVTLERPFGVAPSLGADIHFENLDLDQVTSAFSFGGMSGRLMGTIAGLRLVDWSPVAFDAWLRTNGGGRMSYKAVDDITAIGGGGGLSANLQTMALKLFDTFGYRRLGIRCRLRDEVCLMGGIDPLPAQATAGSVDAGYTIVEGSSLPRIMIVGHRRRVDWPTLVRRLEEATQGQGPVIH